MPSWPLVIIGAGAAGMTAALFAAREGQEVLLIDGRRQPGAKIRVSGGGRCNVLPSESELTDFETRGSYPVVRNILRSWPRQSVQDFFEDDLGVALVRESTGKLFPKSNDSKEIVDALLRALSRAQVTTRFGVRVVNLTPQGCGGFAVRLENNETLLATRVIVATGGLSMPRTGSDGSGWQMLERLGHCVVDPVPALVPLHGEPFGGAAALSGLSTTATLRWRAGDKELWAKTGDFLFTHRGYSGPVVLDASRHWTLAHGKRSRAENEPMPSLLATFGEAAHAPCPKTFWREQFLNAKGASVPSIVRAAMPRRLAEALLSSAASTSLCEKPARELTRTERNTLEERLAFVALPVSSSEGYRTAEVTSGGVPLSEIFYQTLESRMAPGLSLCGETLDVSGRLGGFNFLWAWVTGRLAGRAAAQAVTKAMPARKAG